MKFTKQTKKLCNDIINKVSELENWSRKPNLKFCGTDDYIAWYRFDIETIFVSSSIVNEDLIGIMYHECKHHSQKLNGCDGMYSLTLEWVDLMNRMNKVKPGGRAYVKLWKEMVKKSPEEKEAYLFQIKHDPNSKLSKEYSKRLKSLGYL